jgi:hypothetical protein
MCSSVARRRHMARRGCKKAWWCLRVRAAGLVFAPRPEYSAKDLCLLFFRADERRSVWHTSRSRHRIRIGDGSAIQSDTAEVSVRLVSGVSEAPRQQFPRCARAVAAIGMRALFGATSARYHTRHLFV